MELFVEIFIACAVFTLIVVVTTIKDPLLMVEDYPPEIVERVKELGLIKESQDRKSKNFIIKRIFVVFIMALVMALVVYNFNNADTFLKGFLYSYLLWLMVNWYDAIVLDLIWFRNSKKVRIPGTEDMKAYKNCMFHIKAGFKGMILGIPVCLLVGCFVLFFKL